MLGDFMSNFVALKFVKAIFCPVSLTFFHDCPFNQQKLFNKLILANSALQNSTKFSKQKIA